MLDAMNPTTMIKAMASTNPTPRIGSPSQLSIFVKIADADVHRQRERHDDDETAQEISEKAGHGGDET